MVILVVVVQFVGVFLVFLIIPIYLIPFLEERFEERVPRAAEREARAITWSSIASRRRSRRCCSGCATNNVPALVVETDEARARAVMERKQARRVHALR